MSGSDRGEQEAIRELAQALWEGEGRPEGRALAHWEEAVSRYSKAYYDDPLLNEAEAVIAGDPGADFPALMTKDASGG